MLGGEDEMENLDLLSHRTARFSTWLDEQIGETLISDETLVWIRLAKCGEEAGEVMDALTGATGTNPRKGFYASWADVKKELLDVAHAALGAYEHLCAADANSGGPDERGTSGRALLEHARTRLERVGILE